VAVGDRRVGRSVCGVAERAVAFDVDAVLQAVALERDGELLPGPGELGAGGGRLAEKLADVRWRVVRGALGPAVDLGPAAALAFGLGGQGVGGGAGVVGEPLVGVAAGGPQARELELDALDVGVVAVDLGAQRCRGVEQGLAFGALAPPERLGLVVKRAGPLGLLAGELRLTATRPRRRGRRGSPACGHAPRAPHGWRRW
jgi:hypothetical protein